MDKKKIIVIIVTTILLISAIVYRLLYTNQQKNEIIEELTINEPNIDVEPIVEVKEITVFVDVAGEVVEPGLYELQEGARVNDAILAAGGVTEKADMTQVNLAYILSDEMKITIPPKVTKTTVSTPPNAVISTGMTTNEVVSAENKTGKININTAGKAELETLKGIGSAMAERIMEYRKNNGSFRNIEDIKKVSGIGDAKYEAMKEQITV